MSQKDLELSLRSLRSMNRSKGPGSVLKGLIPVLEAVQTRLVLKRPQRSLNRRTLDRITGPWTGSQNAPGLVSEIPGTGPRGPWTWSQKALELSLRSIRSEPIFKGPGLVLERLRQVLEGLTRTGLREPWTGLIGP